MTGRRFLPAAALAFALTSCLGGVDLDKLEFACTSTDQCATGYHCDGVRSVCVNDGLGGSGGGSAGGGSGGGGGGVGVGGGAPEVDAGDDAGFDGGIDDAGIDAGTDAGADAGIDAGIDAGFDAGYMDAGGVQGALCGQGSDCQNGRCVNGRCCESACNAPCDFCNLPGQAGLCRVAALGRTPSTSCPGGYACNGLDVGCAVACTADAGCVGAARCGSGNLCIQKISTLAEDFSTGFDAGLWNTPPNTCTVVNQQYEVVTTPGTTQFPMLRSKRRYDLTDSELRFELVNAGNQSLNTMQAVAQLCTFPAGNRCFSFIANGNYSFIQFANNSTYSNLVNGSSFTAPARFRMREQAGTLTLARMNDAGVYVQLGSAVTPFGNEFTDVVLTIGAGTYQIEDAGSTVVWDNLNTP